MPRSRIDLDLSLGEGRGQAQNIFFKRSSARVDTSRGDRFLEALSGVTGQAGRSAVQFLNRRSQERAEAGEKLGRQAAADPALEQKLREEGALDHVDAVFFEENLNDQRGTNRAAESAAGVVQSLPENATLEETQAALLEARREGLEGETDPFFRDGFDTRFRGEADNIFRTQTSRLRQQLKLQADSEISIATQREVRELLADPAASVDNMNFQNIANGLTGSTSEDLATVQLKHFTDALELTGDRRFFAAAQAIRYPDGTTLFDRHGIDLFQALESGEARADRESRAIDSAEIANRDRVAEQAIVAIARGIESGEFTTPDDVPEALKVPAEGKDQRFRTNTLPEMFAADVGGAPEDEFGLFKSNARRGLLGRADAQRLLDGNRVNAGQYDELLGLADAAEKGAAKTITQNPIFKANVSRLNKVIEIPGASLPGVSGFSSKGPASIYEAETEIVAERALFEHLSQLDDQSTANIETEARKFVDGVSSAVRATEFPQAATRPETLAGPAADLQRQVRRVGAELGAPLALALAESDGSGFEGATPEEDAVIVETLRAYAQDPDNPPPALAAYALENNVTLEIAVLALHMQRPNTD